MSGKRFAAIDIGTNTVLLLIAELRSDGTFEALRDEAAITRLGESVDKNLRIGTEGEKRSLEILRRYVEQCNEFAVAREEIVAVGTSALRDAGNRSELQARIRETLGLELRVLSGAEEAAYSFLAVRRGLKLPGKELLVVDVGGGSTELIRGDAEGISDSVSLDIGSVRLTERFLHSDPVEEVQFARMTKAIDEALDSLGQRWSRAAAAPAMAGVGGTFTTLAAVEKKLLSYSHSEVHGCCLSLKEVRRQVQLFKAEAVAERKKIPGLEAERADVILAGACLIERTMARFNVETVIVSDQGVRYGLLHERLEALRE